MDPATLMMLANMFQQSGGGGGGQGPGGMMGQGPGGMMGQGGGGFGGFGGGGGGGHMGLFGGPLGPPIGQIISGIFGHSDAPYRAAEKELGDFYNRARDVQNPFMQYGMKAMPLMNQWLRQQRDPSGFINKLMGGYQESPWAKYQQEQMLRAAGNQGAAGGLLGSTPMAQFEQQQARGISSQDMNTWLQNVLGINTQYGAGLQGQLGMGQHAADQLADINRSFGRDIAAAQYGAKAGEQADRANIWGGLFG